MQIRHAILAGLVREALKEVGGTMGPFPFLTDPALVALGNWANVNFIGPIVSTEPGRR